MTSPLEPVALADITEEVPSASISRPASHPTFVDFPRETDAPPHDHVASSTHQHQPHPPITPRQEYLVRGRTTSSVSHVSVEFFDPAGVRQLRRVMTGEDVPRVAQDVSREESPQESSASSDITRVSGEEPFDFARALNETVRRREEANIKPRKLGIVFRDIEVVGEGASDSYQPTLSTLLNPRCILQNIQKARHPTLKTILTGFEGVIKPGEMLLVLGSPGSGCSTFLKTLANHRKGYYSVKGTVNYDSLTPSDVAKHYRGDVQYCPEDDIHFPTLTVQQTIQFASTVRTPRTRLDGFTRKQFRDRVTDVLTTIFGLRHALKTVVGDAAIRGVSGGEKKRVSLAEALAARSCINAWDNSTRGLDASTALEFVRALRIATDTFNTTTMVSIYQAGESLFELFDKVCVIYEGKMAYYGPASEAKQYFIDMGYEPANRQTTPDFLVAVTDPNARIPRSGITGQPRTAEEFAAHFQASKIGKWNREEMSDYETKFVGKQEMKTEYVASARAEFAKHTRQTSPYLLSIPQQVRAVMLRRVEIMKGNSLLVILNLFSFIFQAIIMGTVFYKSPQETSAYFSRGGVLFFALLFSALTAMAEIPALYAQRPIVHRHQLAAFYHPFVEAAALTLVDIPITLATIIVYCIIIYFMVGLQRSVDQFFVFLLFIFSMSIVMKAWFRAIAAAFRSEAGAQTVAGLSILALSIYTGYTIPKPTMIGALRWITYINPLKYGFESIVTNEFRTLDGRCSNLIPQGPGYEGITLANQVCGTLGSVPGQPDVNGARFVQLSYGFSWSHTWMNFGLVIAFGVGFIIALLAFTELNTASSHETSVTLFQRHSKGHIVKKDDEESGAVSEKTPANSTKSRGAKTAEPILKHEDIFSWQHINYTVSADGQQRKLLDDVSGFVAPGKLTALMGESGAGKTTLLNVLASRTSVGVVTGDRFVNGQPLPDDFQSQSGYCQQMDTHVPLTTVREALLFSAKLRQPASVSISEKEEWVEKCLRMCGLEAYAEATVGTLNTEQKKRTTIAVELAAKPKLLLFLDEPTSGLDSQSAWAIVSFLRSLADQGQAILCTIHQPSAELFQVFDRLLLLRKGGQTVYFGDLGHNSTQLIQYFERNGGRACRDGENPAEYILDVIGAGATATSEQDWHAVWVGSSEVNEMRAELDKIHTEGRKRPAVAAEFHSKFATTWLYQFWELFVRDARVHWRNPSYLMAKLALNAAGGLFIGFTFWKSDDSQQGTQNKLFAIFMATILSVPLSNQLQVPYIDMRKVYEIRERPTRMYSWTALVASQIAVEVPWNIVGSCILFFSWYWTVGFPSSRAGYTFLMMVFVFPFYYTTFGLAVASMAPSAEIAALLFSFLFSFVLTFDGVLQPYARLGWWQWMYRLSPYTYLIEGLLGQAIGHQEINCSPVEFVSVEPLSGQTCQQFLGPYMSMAGGYITNPTATSSCQFCTFRTTDEFMGRTFNIFWHHHWRNFGFMIAFILFNIFLVFSLTYLFRIRTGSLLPSLRLKRKKN